MQKFNYPTTIYYGENALKEAVQTIAERGHKRLLFVSDTVLSELGLVDSVRKLFYARRVETVLFDQVHPNPIEADVWAAAALFKSHHCDGIFSLGGGSPNDTAKVVAIAATHDGPLARFEDCKGGDAHVVHPLPPIYSAATTAGTGSEVGRSGLVTLECTGLKTIIFHPDLLPKIAILDPELTTGLPAMITATTGVDALSHNLEAYFARGFHPMADGIALEGMALVLDNLPKVLKDGSDLDGRARMLLASAMGATAFQKGLGAAHAMANALTAHNDMHHGTGIALVLPATIKWLETVCCTETEMQRLTTVGNLFRQRLGVEGSLSRLLHRFIKDAGIPMGLMNHGIDAEVIPALSRVAFEDPTHAGNMVPVRKNDLAQMFEAAMEATL